jgi:hypothetical protein
MGDHPILIVMVSHLCSSNFSRAMFTLVHWSSLR